MIGYRLLGPLEVTVDGVPADLCGRRQRALLAILLLHVNQPVHRDVLVDQLWGEHPPAAAEHALNVYIWRLRKTLHTPAGTPAVLTRRGAYLLQAAEEQIDVAAFGRLAREGQRALAVGAPGPAAELLGDALELWRGAPLADFRFEPFAQAEIARLEELRAGVVEDRIEADIALGRHAQVLSELEALAAADPLRERLHQQRMIALYRCGRQADALAAYQDARRVLMNELGLEPGPALRELECAILRQDPSLQPPPGPPASRVPAAPGSRRSLGRVAVAHPRRLLAVTGAAAAAALLAAAVGALPPAPAPPPAGPDTVAVIDAGRPAVSAVVTGIGRPGGVATGAGASWVTDSSDDLLLRVDPAGRVTDRIPVGHGPAGVATGGGQVWVANQLDGTVSEVNSAAGTVVATIEVGNGPGAVASGYGSVWVANTTDKTLSRIDPGSSHVVATIPLRGAPAGLAAGDGGVWVAIAGARSLVRVDYRTNRVSRSVRVSGAAAGVTTGAGSVWAAYASGRLARLDPRTGRARTIRLGGEPAGIAYADGAVWVTDRDSGSVVRMDPRSGSVRRLHLGDQPAAVTGGGGTVLATVLPSPGSHRGGTLTLAANLAPGVQATDPAVAATVPVWQMLDITNDGLVVYRKAAGAAGDTLVPDLAQALPAPADGGRTYAFRLRPGIKYSTGAPVRAEDFRRAIERVFRLNGGEAGLFSGISGAGHCERAPRQCDLTRGIVTSDRAGTVTFHLTTPDPDFLYKLALPLADAVPPGTPDHPIRPAQLPATGPYLTQSFVAGHSWTLVRNPGFRPWSDQAQPPGYPSRIVLRLDLPAGSAASAVEQRRADVLLSPPAAELPALATRYPSQLASGPLGTTVGLALNTRAWPFKVLAARQAVSYAIDRKRLVELVGGPLAAQPTCQILPPGQPGYQPYCPYTLDPGPGAGWTAPDLARAEHLVSISGTRGARVIVLTGESGTSLPGQAAGRFLVSMLDQLGYRASLQAISDSVADGRRLNTSRQRPQVGWVSWSQDYPAPSDFLSPLLTCGSFPPGRRDAAGYCNRRIGRQVAQARALQSHRLGTAEALWSHIDHELTDEVPWVPLFNPRSLVMLSSRVGNYEYDPYGAVLIDQLWVTGPSGGPVGQAAGKRATSAAQR